MSPYIRGGYEVSEEVARAYLLGLLDEHLGWMRGTLRLARELGCGGDKIKQAYSLLADVLRETRAQATGRSEEDLCKDFFNRLRQATPELPTYDEIRGPPPREVELQDKGPQGDGEARVCRCGPALDQQCEWCAEVTRANNGPEEPEAV